MIWSWFRWSVSVILQSSCRALLLPCGMVLIAFLLFRDHSLPESNPSRRTQELYIIM
nr:MAG TPA: hypothetical protein [Caudoviricetes sp.]